MTYLLLLFACGSSTQKYEALKGELFVNASSIYDAVREVAPGQVTQEPYPRAINQLTADPASWSSGASGVFKTVGWMPDGHVRGTYAIDIRANEETYIHAWADLDGDGNPSHLVVTAPTVGKITGKWLPDEGVTVTEEHHKARGMGGASALRALVWVTPENVY